jgi:hypothetical protein
MFVPEDMVGERGVNYEEGGKALPLAGVAWGGKADLVR